MAVGFLVTTVWDGIPGFGARVSMVRRRITEIDRAHFDMLVHEVARHPNLEFNLFACHMLAYFAFTPYNTLGDRTSASPLPDDPRWWKPPGTTDVEQALQFILQTDILQSVPPEQYFGVLAHIRRTAQTAIKRINENIVDPVPTRESVNRIAALIESAAQRNLGPRLESGAFIRQFVQTCD